MRSAGTRANTLLVCYSSHVTSAAERAEKRRATWIGGVAHSFAEADEMDIVFWANATPEERVRGVTQLIEEMRTMADEQVLRSDSRAVMTRGLALAAGLLLVFASSALADIVTGPPTLVVRFELTPQTTTPPAVRVSASIQLPNGRRVSRSIRNVIGRCHEDVGGAESLAVVFCAGADGRAWEFEVFEVSGRRIVVDEFVTREGGERRRVQRHLLGRSQPGWQVVPRCRETAIDPRACIPSRTPVP